ncbi:MAG TPA: O-methyltransferase [Elusimicrobiota bacterium]|jgi:predicted O-methyltransferase YrrM|nr:O-methyltransferase [Elusimicrobiota bacterium]
MNQELWSAVDQYVVERLAPRDEDLEAAQKASADAGLPPISVSAAQGKLLSLYATMIGARRILEIGTLGGYSTLWMGWALPVGGSIVTLEADPKHAEVARANIARAGLADSVQVRVGKALETLPQLAAENPAPFDMFFIDANKDAIPEYFQWALKLGRKGSLIIVDNVVRGGKILDAASPDANVQGVRRFYDMLAKETRVSATAIQTVGVKGYDGFALAVVL